jgi:hypothetical protein
VDHVGDEEGQGGGPLRLHPLRHPRRHELRAQAPPRPAPLPHLGLLGRPDPRRRTRARSIPVIQNRISCYMRIFYLNSVVPLSL